MTHSQLPSLRTRPGRVLMEIGALLVGFLLLLAVTGFKYYWITDFMVFCILVLSFDLLYGYLGHLSFGHILYYGTGAYVAAGWMVYFSSNPVIALLVGVAVTTLLATAIGWIAVQTEGASFALLTMAFNELGYFVVHTALSAFTKGDDGLIASPGKVFGLLRFGKDREAFLMVLVIFLSVFAVLRVVTRSPYGVLIRSIKENETRIRFLGYDAQKYKWLTFVISAAIAGLAGGLFVMVQGFVSPRAISTLSNIEVIFAILIGGAGNLYGAVVGGVIFMLVKNYIPAVIAAMEGVVGFALPQWEMWLGIILLVIVFSFRKGVTGFVADKAGAALNKIRSGKGAR